MLDILGLATDVVNFLLEKGPFALLLFIIVGEMGTPIPIVTDGLLLVAGYGASSERSNILLAFGMLLVGSLLGASAIYWLARLGGRPLIRRYGHYLGLTLERLDRVETRMQRWGARAVLFGRLTPGLLVATNIASGLFRIPYATFAGCVVVTAAAWGALVLGVGYLLRLGFGATLATLARDRRELWAVPVLLFGIGVILGWVVLRRHLARRQSRARAPRAR
ncbi:MAG: DedA family protein [Chloroflexi bacterium]|nr:DedA family protein [Chloroflexota bacterium]